MHALAAESIHLLMALKPVLKCLLQAATAVNWCQALHQRILVPQWQLVTVLWWDALHVVVRSYIYSKPLTLWHQEVVYTACSRNWYFPRLITARSSAFCCSATSSLTLFPNTGMQLFPVCSLLYALAGHWCFRWHLSYLRWISQATRDPDRA